VPATLRIIGQTEMAYEATEYGFIKINNRKAVGLRPATHAELSAALAPVEIGHILTDLVTAGWRLSPDNTFTGNEIGDYELKIERPVQREEPEDANYDYVKIDAQEPIDQLAHLVEKKGYDLIGIFRLPVKPNLVLLSAVREQAGKTSPALSCRAEMRLREFRAEVTLSLRPNFPRLALLGCRRDVRHMDDIVHVVYRT
jgi:hypothetical protein